MPPRAEAGAELAVRHRRAQQELPGAAAFAVEIVDAAVAAAETVEIARRAAEARRDVEQLGILRHLVVAVGLREEHFEPVGRVEPRLEVDVGSEQPDELLRHRRRHAVGIGGLVDAVIDGRQVAARAHRRRRVVECGQQLRIGLRLLGRDELLVVVERDRQYVRGAVVNAGAHHLRLVAMDHQPDAQHRARLERLGVEQLAISPRPCRSRRRPHSRPAPARP